MEDVEAQAGGGGGGESRWRRWRWKQVEEGGGSARSGGPTQTDLEIPTRRPVLLLLLRLGKTYFF